MRTVARSPLIRHLEYRMHTQRMSNFIVETGKKGAGKSWLGLRFGEVINGKDFDLNRVCFSSKILFERLDDEDFKEGDVVMLEELGIAANSRDAMSRTNKHLSFIAQAIRPARITLISNTITWGLIDSQVKNMADFKLSVLGFDVQTGLTEFKFMKISPNDNGQEPFKEHLQFDGVKHVSWEMKRPSAELAEPYEKARAAYLRGLYADGAQTMSGNQDIRFGQGKIKPEAKPTLEQLAENVLSFKENFMIDGQLSRGLVANTFNIGANKASFVVAIAKKRWELLGAPPI